MQKMEIDRRSFLSTVFTGLAASLLSAPLFSKSLFAENKNELFAAARTDAAGQHYASIFGLEQGEILSIALPDRGHDIAVHPFQKDCVFFARRPGRFAVALSYNHTTPPHWFYASSNRHFYGHGVFSSDGALLYTSENDYENSKGVIGIRDVAKGYLPIGEFPSYGVGPHDMALMADGKTLVVANGGIETHPETGREKLNLAEMKPSLAYIDCKTGDLLEQHFLSADLHQLSIRHLAVSSDGYAVFGGQFEGPADDQPPLIGFHKRGQDIKLVEAPDEVQRNLKNYIGSVSVDQSGRYVAASAPKGNLITYWDAQKQVYINSTSLADGCGLASSAQDMTFIITSGEGKFGTATPSGFSKLFERKSEHWDNHAVFLKS